MNGLNGQSTAIQWPKMGQSTFQYVLNFVVHGMAMNIGLFVVILYGFLLLLSVLILIQRGSSKNTSPTTQISRQHVPARFPNSRKFSFWKNLRLVIVTPLQLCGMVRASCFKKWDTEAPAPPPPKWNHHGAKNEFPSNSFQISGKQVCLQHVVAFRPNFDSRTETKIEQPMRKTC